MYNNIRVAVARVVRIRYITLFNSFVSFLFDDLFSKHRVCDINSHDNTVNCE